MSMSNVKEFLEEKRNKARVALAVPAATVMCALPALAAEGGSNYGSTISTSLKTGVQDIVNNVTTMVGDVLPVALVIFGIFMTVKFGMKFIKQVTGK